MSPGQTWHIVLLAMIFSAFLVLSNLTAMKIIHIWHITTTAALIFFPITYVFDDILTEVYGFKVSRRIIWSALLCNIVVIGGTMITVILPPDSNWHLQNAYQNIFLTTPRIFAASLLSYLVGEFFNAIMLAKLKIKTQGKHLWLRCIVSTALGLALDTMIFAWVSFYHTLPNDTIWAIIFNMYFLKLGYEVIALPLTYWLCGYLKRKDHVDHYDTNTRFNPFSWKI